MTAPHGTPRAEMRRHQVDDTVARLSAALDDAPPPRRASLHAQVSHLRDALGRAHRRSDEVDDRAWADYVERLDRGVDELHLELARAAEHPTGPAAEPPTAGVFARASRLELDGWRLRFDVHGSRPDLLHHAEQEIQDFEQRAEASTEAPRDAVRQALAAVRGAAGEGEGQAQGG